MTVDVCNEALGGYVAVVSCDQEPCKFQSGALPTEIVASKRWKALTQGLHKCRNAGAPDVEPAPKKA